MEIMGRTLGQTASEAKPEAGLDQFVFQNLKSKADFDL